MSIYFRILMVTGCLAGQVISAFGSPILAFSDNQNNSSLLIMGCCCSKSSNACCSDGCCCSSNIAPEIFKTDDVPLSSEEFSFAWINPVSSNRCKGLQIIHDLGTDQTVETPAPSFFGVRTLFMLPGFCELSSRIYSEIKTPPPKAIIS
ncbi:MAG: hypothetical protein RL595_3340 [Planctomycetota bacterium]